MLNLDPAKLLVIAVVAIILLGPDRLPQVGRQVGAAWRSFNEFRHRMESEVRNTMPDLPSTSEIARLARSPSALLNHLSNMSDTPSTNGDAESSTNGDGTVDLSAEGEDGDAGTVDLSADDGGTVSSFTDHGTAVGEPAPGEPARTAPATPPFRPAEPATRDEPLPEPAAGTGSTPRLVPSDPGVVAPGDPTLN